MVVLASFLTLSLSSISSCWNSISTAVLAFFVQGNFIMEDVHSNSINNLEIIAFLPDGVTHPASAFTCPAIGSIIHHIGSYYFVNYEANIQVKYY
jgi:hypothetical protein